MKITITSNYDQKATGENVNAELTQLFRETMSKDVSDDDLHWVSDGEVVLKKESPLSLHSFLLKAEELGKRIKYNKQTIIEILE